MSSTAPDAVAGARPGSPAAALPATCPACGAAALLPAGASRERRVCERCGACWERDPDGAVVDVDTLSCRGCPQRTICESRPSWLADSLSSVHDLADGTRILVRPLLYSDRDELASRYEVLSPESKRLRFFGGPSRLSPQLLEYLTNLDYHDHFALGGFLVDRPGRPGVGVARFVRLSEDPALAEAAVTVVDELQSRGVGTLLLTRLAEAARERGIRTFVSFVLWENARIIEALRQIGGRVTPGEPGVARLEMDLPAPEVAAPPSLHVVLQTIAAHRAAGTPTGGPARAATAGTRS